MNTVIAEDSPEGQNFTDVFSKLEEQKIFFLSEEITDDLASYICANLMLIDSDPNKKNDEPITLFINSAGGDIRNVLMIYDVMQQIETPIMTICSGEVEDEAVLLLAAGEPGLRFATENSTISIDKIRHYGSQYSDLYSATVTQKRLKVSNDLFYKAMSDTTGYDLPSIKSLLSEKKFLTPSLAKKHGIIDQIMKGQK